MNAVSIPGSEELEVLSPSCIEISQGKTRDFLLSTLLQSPDCSSVLSIISICEDVGQQHHPQQRLREGQRHGFHAGQHHKPPLSKRKQTQNWSVVTVMAYVFFRLSARKLSLYCLPVGPTDTEKRAKGS
ncbi:hypothetical protein AVEN_93123-1 [Araneus ventricosus]|uniref:Uncharacterized protein n=1 Tax=Araneus ventricosus TaxID=182803 RepID=A0A4Y2V4F0_ARAVE|nr:hypothetical protein AVEN_93123-1 [Araneus ventricosus]